MRRSTMILITLGALVGAACDGSDPAGPGEPGMPVASVVVAPDTASLSVGETRVLQAKAYAADGTLLAGRKGSWRSSDTTVVSVDSLGAVAARSHGVARVTVTVEGKTGHSTVRVQAVVVPVASVEIGPAGTMTISMGQTIQLTAKAYGADGAQLTGRAVTWTSSRQDIAPVNGEGAVHGLAAGVAEITATIEGKSARAQVTVQSPVPVPAVATVEIRPNLVVTYAGVDVPLVATLKAADGTVLSGRTITWTSSVASVATVDANGVVRGHLEGEAVITASVEGKTATAAVLFNTVSSYHLAYDREASAFYWMDMRTGAARKTLEHGQGIHSLDPSPSPTRSGFAYVYRSELGGTSQIAIQSWSGLTYHFLTDGDQPAWSPDGTRIAFRRTRDGRTDIWSMLADGSANPVNLTADLPVGVNSEHPAWSPSGDRIVFAASHANGGTDLWLMKSDGSQKHTLTHSPHRDTEPTWFGDRIVFTRRTALGTSELYWMYVNGASVAPLTALGGAQMPAWSPDGRWIAFVVRDGETGVGDIYAMRPDGTDVRPLSLRQDGPTGGGLNPAWTLHW